MWEYCGMERSEEGLLKAIDLIRGLRDEFWRNVKAPGAADTLNQSLEKAGRVADFLEPASSCASTRCTAVSRAAATSAPRARPTTGEALRHDDEYAYVAAWEWAARTAPRPCTRKTWSTNSSS